MKYIVVSQDVISSGIELFIKKVENMIRQGWEPIGGIAVDRVRLLSSYGKENVITF